MDNIDKAAFKRDIFRLPVCALDQHPDADQLLRNHFEFEDGTFDEGDIETHKNGYVLIDTNNLVSPEFEIFPQLADRLFYSSNSDTRDLFADNSVETIALQSNMILIDRAALLEKADITDEEITAATERYLENKETAKAALQALGRDLEKMGIAFHEDGTAVVTLPQHNSPLMQNMWKQLAAQIPEARIGTTTIGGDLTLRLTAQSLEALAIEAPEMKVDMSDEHPAVAAPASIPPHPPGEMPWHRAASGGHADAITTGRGDGHAGTKR